MSGSVKNMGTDVAKSQNFAIFVVRDDTNGIHKVHTHRSIALSLVYFRLCRWYRLAAKWGQRFFFAHTYQPLKLLTDKCEAKLKAARRHEVSYLHNTSLEYLSAPSGVGLTTTNQVLSYRTTTRLHPKRRQSVWLANTSSRFFHYTPLWRVKSSVHF